MGNFEGIVIATVYDCSDPFIKGQQLSEEPLDNNDVIESTQCHKIYEDWLAFIETDFIIDVSLIENDCLKSKEPRLYTNDISLPIQVMFQSKHIINNPYSVMKKG